MLILSWKIILVENPLSLILKDIFHAFQLLYVWDAREQETMYIYIYFYFVFDPQ